MFPLVGLLFKAFSYKSQYIRVKYIDMRVWLCVCVCERECVLEAFYYLRTARSVCVFAFDFDLPKMFAITAFSLTN